MPTATKEFFNHTYFQFHCTFRCSARDL